MRRLLVALGLVVMASSATAESLQYSYEKTRIDAMKIHNAMDALEQQIQQQKSQGKNTQRAEHGLTPLHSISWSILRCIETCLVTKEE